MQTRLTTKKEAKYSYGSYNVSNEQEQWIRITEGCPHNCPYCYEPQKVMIFGIPDIIRNEVKIIDMNLLYKQEALYIIQELRKKRVNGKVVYYELVCGVDFRFLTSLLAKALHLSRFKKIRLAWDWTMKDQYKLKDAIKMLTTAGYKSRDLMLFMICNWKIPYEECCKKLDLLKVWNVKVDDCWFDNQLSPNIIPLHWTDEEIKKFRKKCRKHNHLINFRIDPEVK